MNIHASLLLDNMTNALAFLTSQFCKKHEDFLACILQRSKPQREIRKLLSSWNKIPPKRQRNKSYVISLMQILTDEGKQREVHVTRCQA